MINRLLFPQCKNKEMQSKAYLSSGEEVNEFADEILRVAKIEGKIPVHKQEDAC